MRDLAGITAGIMFASAYRSALRKNSVIFLSIGLITLLGGLAAPVYSLSSKLAMRAQFPTLASFEHGFDRFAVRRMRAELDVVPAPVAWHNAGAVLQVRPRESSGYSGVRFVNFPRDWSSYEYLVLTLGSESDATVSVTVRIYDETSTRNYFDQFNVLLQVGRNPQSVRIPMAEIAAGPAERILDVSQISQLLVFTDGPVGFFVDDVRLE